MPGGRIGLLFACVTAFSLHAESGSDAWLRYQRLPARVAEADVQALGDSVMLLGGSGSSEVLLAARDELSRGMRRMLGRVPRIEGSERDPISSIRGGLARRRFSD